MYNTACSPRRSYPFSKRQNFHYLLDQTASQAHSGRPCSVYNSCDIYTKSSCKISQETAHIQKSHTQLRSALRMEGSYMTKNGNSMSCEINVQFIVIAQHRS